MENTQNKQKQVGIVIPIYNVEKYLKDCLESVINQTYKNLKIVLVDDGSTDSSLSIAKEYATKDNRITIITKENGGQATARNAGIEYFSGKQSAECGWQIEACHTERSEVSIKETIENRFFANAQNDKASLRGSEATEAIYNIESQAIPSVDCHDSLRESRNDKAECGWQIETCHTERSEVSKKETTENRFFANAQNDKNARHCEALKKPKQSNALDAKNIISEIQSVDCHENSCEFSRNDKKNTESQSKHSPFCHTERSEISIKETIENRFFANAQNDNNDKVDSASLHSALCNPLSATDSVSPLSADCPPHTDDIDYLIFLDSDDFWELNCVEECVKRMDGVDILWFDSKTFLDGVKKSDYKSIMKWLHYTHEQVISREEWANRLRWSGICWWAWAGQGMIDFSYLKKIGLEFINGIAQEDDAFGIYLFSQANYIYVLPRELYQYRIRANSTMNYGGKVSLSSINVFFRPYLKDFKGDLVALKAYWHQSSFVKTTLAIIELLENLKDEHTKAVIKDCLMHNYTNLALGILKSPSDPLGLVDEVAKFKDYVKEDKKPHGAVEMVKNSIKYKIGFYILKARGVKEILALPGRIKGFINTEKKATKLYKERLKKYPFAKKPSLKEYADYNEALKYTEHLSYKLGDIAYRNYKWWFCGAFLLLPFELLWAGVRFNTRGLKRSRTLMLDRLNAIQSQVSRIAWNPPQVVEKIEGFGESAQERNMFYKLADSKGALCVTNYTNDAWIKRVLHCGGCVELVEENHLRFKEFKLKYKECDNVRLRYGSFRENPRVRLGDTSGLGILPPLFWDINALPLPEKLDFEQLCNSIDGEVFWLNLYIDYHNYKLLDGILNYKTKSKISFISLILDSSFKNSNLFKDNYEKRLNSLDNDIYIYIY